MKKRAVYLNGQFVSENEAKISIFDSGFWQDGIAVYDVARTFQGKPYKLREHIERLYRSCYYFRIDPGMSQEEMQQISIEILSANIDPDEIRKNGDYMIYQCVTPGINGHPTIIVYCKSIDFTSAGALTKARAFKEGLHVVTPSIKHVPPQCVDPKAKIFGRIWFKLASLEARGLGISQAWPLLLDLDGNVTESIGANFFIVKEENLVTPGTRNILCGISRQTVFELARELGIQVLERDIQVYDVYNADEAFLAQTSSCILPVSKLNGVKIGEEIPGSITKRLLDAWSVKVGVDIVEQYTCHLNEV